MMNGSEKWWEGRGLLKGFPPVLGDSPKVLILGSMPSTRSLLKNEYYGHPRNRFWPMMQELLAGRCEKITYEERKALLKSKSIALWDSIASCRREGSLDSSIHDAVVNPIDKLLEATPDIRWIFFNGRAAEKAFWRAFPRMSCGENGISFLALPSTSPANAAWSLEKLKAIWGASLSKAGIVIRAFDGSSLQF